MSLAPVLPAKASENPQPAAERARSAATPNTKLFRVDTIAPDFHAGRMYCVHADTQLEAMTTAEAAASPGWNITVTAMAGPPATR